MSLYSMRGCRPGGPFTGLLDEIGIGGEIEFLHSPGSYLVRDGAETLPVTTQVDEMVEALEAIYTDREEAKRRSQAAVDFMQGWSWPNQIGRLLKELVWLPG